MTKFDFTKQFTEIIEPLDMFFHKKLKKAKIKFNLEEIKNDLIQDTAYAVLKKLTNEKYLDYSLPALIWTKAEDVWKEYASSHLKKKPYYISDESYAEHDYSYNLMNNYELSDIIDVLKSKAGITNWDILIMHVLEGYSYKDIAERLRTSEDSIKMKIFRLKKKLHQTRL